MRTTSDAVRPRRPLLATLAAAVVALASVIAGPALAASADDGVVAAPTTHQLKVGATLTGSQFKPGNIISDDQFYQRDAMSRAEIQAFLNTMIGTCQNNLCLNILFSKTTNRAADRNICSAYATDSDGKETTATIIYKVQQACGISAKVLLVTLQKEQGLITDKSPTTGELQIAMGYACPDTAACNTKYYGLFNQIYSAAWQFKRYSTPDPWGSYQPGVRTIKYNPNSSCGTKSVNIANNATAALYNYTPYTPNAAALANLYGSAPPCGSYGNRNFWVFYNTWFGNSTAGDGLAHVQEAYADAGGATGPLGAASGAGSCTRSVYSCYQNYEHGVIYWSSPFGAFVVSGAFGDYYLAKGGPTGVLGPPTTDYYTVTDPNGDGNTQGFATGMIYSGPGGLVSVAGDTQNAYSQSGWLRGDMGWPIAEAVCASGGCTQATQHGTIYGSSRGAAALDNTIDAVYRSAGGPTGSLGWPSTNATTIDAGANGSGRTLGFASAMLYSSTAGTFTVTSAIQKLYEANGWVRGDMGWPDTAATCSLPGGGCTQSFQHGDIYAPKTGAGYAITSDAIADAYRTAGGPAGSWGWPITRTVAKDTGANGAGHVQAFRNGYTYTSPAGTAFLKTSLQTAYVAGGWVTGALGWPASAPTCTLPGGGCTLDFQHGVLYQSATGQGFPISNQDIADAYDAAGGPAGPLGWPTTLSVAISSPNGNGYSQGFKNGQIYSSADGTFALQGKQQAGYIAAGWVRGPLGWPTADPVCAAGDCTQEFQHGTLYLPASGAGFAITDTRIADYYTAHGGPGGALGFPITATAHLVTATNGQGAAQGFANGYIYANALGTFSVTGAMHAEHIAAGWVRGAIGFPTADASCAAGTCTQTFQHGTLTTP